MMASVLRYAIILSLVYRELANSRRLSGGKQSMMTSTNHGTQQKSMTSPPYDDGRKTIDRRHLEKGGQRQAIIANSFDDLHYNDVIEADRPISNRDNPIEMDLKPVAVKLFRDALSKARTYRDVFRLFHRRGDTLADDDVDDFITSRPGDVTSHSVAIGRLMMRTGSAVKQNPEERLVDWDRALKHVHMEKPECRRPVPEVVYTKDMYIEAHVTYFPQCTVIHQCRKQYGCCEDDYECSVKSSNVVQLPFYTVIEHEGLYQPTPTVKMLSFVNHTECECKPVASESDATAQHRCLRCPWPFTIDMAVTETCSCLCSDDLEYYFYCHSVASGRSLLDSKQVTCILESQCETPVCEFGQFNIQLARCPCHPSDIQCLSRTLEPTGSGEPDDDLLQDYHDYQMDIPV